MGLIFVIGMAGSGKSLLTGSFVSWLRDQEQDAVAVNLDPGAVELPYQPDVDVREYITVEEVMEKYGLGPNGAMIAAADMIATFVKDIEAELDDLGPDVAVVDTPGQMEVFAFRPSGLFIVKHLTTWPKAIVYLFDACFSREPSNFVANIFLASAVYYRFLVPQIHALTKCDLVERSEVHKMIGWSSRPRTLLDALEASLRGDRRLLARDMVRAAVRLGLSFPLIPVASPTCEGFLNLNMALERVLSGGDRYTF